MYTGMILLQVLVPSAVIRGFLDASEYGTWLKHFQSAQDDENQNVKHLLIAGQVSADIYGLFFYIFVFSINKITDV